MLKVTERELSGLNYQKKILAHNMIFIYVVHSSRHLLSDENMFDVLYGDI